MHSAKHSIAASSQKAYRSAWNKWEKFLTKYFVEKMSQNDYQKLQEPELLRQLLMFVSYCVAQQRWKG
jgi:seryl-tRNA synthetase